MQQERWIRLLGSRGIETNSVDGAMVRGEGGSANSQLLIALTTRTNLQPRAL